ncbi:signal peptidase II [Paenibacillus provencensis]|uniref:Lipoprotein signal peptidase n=1 Tax=Paenibacillus provencensis TaxID=441151 RepID=A0ABW3PX83_9BACL
MLRYYVLAVLALTADQLTKWAVVTYMSIGQSIPLIPNIFHLTSHRNRGAAFGILQNQRIFFIVVTIAVVIGILVYLRKVYVEHKLLSVGLSFVLGGAMGNFVDRAFKGEVVDMLHFRLINYPIFNVADCFIVVGCALIFLHTLRQSNQEKKVEV